jgi:hypothetical protein
MQQRIRDYPIWVAALSSVVSAFDSELFEREGLLLTPFGGPVEVAACVWRVDNRTDEHSRTSQYR